MSEQFAAIGMAFVAVGALAFFGGAEFRGVGAVVASLSAEDQTNTGKDQALQAAEQVETAEPVLILVEVRKPQNKGDQGNGQGAESQDMSGVQVSISPCLSS